ncbi:MAG: hypothetical protein U0234_30835 [Sandaracinus sp.]
MRRSAFVLSFAILGCASPPPLSCSQPVDMAGRRIALCTDPSATPVCDDPGATAHYETQIGGGHMLVDGTIAGCDSSGQVVCADRSESPYCLAVPPS